LKPQAAVFTLALSVKTKGDRPGLPRSGGSRA
jgi:hypothetical protein